MIPESPSNQLSPDQPLPAPPADVGSAIPTTEVGTLPEGAGQGLLSLVPDTKEIRQKLLQQIQAEIDLRAFSKELLSRSSLEERARTFLGDHGLSTDLTGWVMVAFSSQYWQREVQKIPYDRRILLIPHCLRDFEQCQGKYDSVGLLCQRCGRCVIPLLLDRAEQLGYLVLIAEGTPVVMRWIMSGKADAILGVGCLKSLERAFDKLLWAGIPAMAVPLLASTCCNTQVDVDRVLQMIETPWIPETQQESNPTWLPLLRAAASLFEPEELERLLSEGKLEKNTKPEQNRAFTFVTSQGRDFLVGGGKFYRPFITLATWHALTCDPNRSATEPITFPDSVKRVALAMEAFHKASLVHDDIEDNDQFRYGTLTLHRQLGIPAAINIGDYLLGYGYRLLAMAAEHSPQAVTDLLRKLSGAHLALCRGQGAELFLSHHDTFAAENSSCSVPLPLDILRIHSLKTAPAFEAALYAGMRLALDSSQMTTLEEPIAQFSRYIGIGFQIRNDLADWNESIVNKVERGSDFLAGRPTLLRAFAAESLSVQENDQLNQFVVEHRSTPSESRRQEILTTVESLYRQSGAFEKSRLLIEKYSTKAKQTLTLFPEGPLREFLARLIETVLR